MKKFLVIFVTMLTLISCDFESKPPTADEVQAKRTQVALMEADRQVGMPAIQNYTERKLTKMIFELRDQEALICHAYLVNEINGTVGQYLGECLGFGIPYSTQFTNPEKRIINSYSSSYGYNLPQADPNGLYMPTSSSATWLMLLDDKGIPHPVYMEPTIIVSPFPLHKVKK